MGCSSMRGVFDKKLKLEECEMRLSKYCPVNNTNEIISLIAASYLSGNDDFLDEKQAYVSR
jgi:hypothetical protein